MRKTRRQSMRRSLAPNATWPPRPTRASRTHYTTTLASRGAAYERWAPVYRYGYELARDRRYADRDWTTMEAEAHRDWEARQQGTWDEVKDTIRYAWDKVRGRR
jgi:hypothetical protein